MSSLYPLKRNALAVLFVCVNMVSSLAATTTIEPVITSNGAVLLEIAEIESGTDLEGIQEYAVMVSEDLREWREIARSTLLEQLRLVDLDGRGSTQRFYRIVGIDLDETVRLFAEEVGRDLAEAQSFASGILVDGFTLEEYEELLDRVAEIRAKIAGMLDQGAMVPESLLLFYRESVGEIDRMLAARPLILDWEGRRYEIEISRAMRVLNTEYARLGEVNLQDYDRLAGVDSEDLEGLETLAEYIARRQVGIELKLPLFEAISPSGQFELTGRLVRKHLDLLSEGAVDYDADGLWEIDYDMYARALNGLERIRRKNVALVQQVETEIPLDFSVLSEGLILDSELKTVLRAIGLRRLSVEELVLNNVASVAIDEAFSQSVLREAWRLINQRRSQDLNTLEKSFHRPELRMELFPEFDLGLEGERLSTADLESALSALRNFRALARENVERLLSDLDLSESGKAEVLGIFSRTLEGYHLDGRWIRGIYGAAFDEWRRATERSDTLYRTSGGGFVRLTKGLWIFLRSLPFEVDELLAYPEIGELMERSELEGYLGKDEYYLLRSVDFQDRVAEGVDSLSGYGIRVQLVQALILKSGDALLTEDQVGLVEFARQMLFGSELDGRVESVDGLYDRALEELAGLLESPSEGSSWRRFYEQKAIADELLDTLMDEALGETSSDDRLEQRFIEQLAADRWDAFWGVLARAWGVDPSNRLWGGSRVIPNATISIVVEGKIHEFSTAWLSGVLEKALGRVAVVSSDGSGVRYQWSRLNGLSDEDLAAVSRVNRYGPSPLDYLQDWDDEDRDRSTEEPNSFEMYLGVLPRWIEGMDASQLLENGTLSAARLEEAAVEGLAYAVEKGSTIRGKVKAAEELELGQFKRNWGNAVFSHWQILEAMEADFLSMKRDLAQVAAPFVGHLSDDERLDLSGSPYDTELRLEVRGILLRAASLGERVLEVGDQSFVIDFHDMRSWLSHWSRRISFVQGFFPGVEESDLVQSRMLNERIYYTADGVLDPSMLVSETIDLRKLIVAVVRRVADSSDEELALYRNALSSEGKVVSETIRRLFKGVDSTFVLISDEAEKIVSEKMIYLRARSREPMTVSNLEDMYESLLSLRSELVELISNRARALDSADVVEIEEAVTAMYQDAFGLLVDYMEGEPLHVEVSGDLVEIPYGELREALLRVLQSRFPGEELAAYHFASFYGISIGELREFNKLEEFLSVQVVALPRNSQYVEVVSKLSGLGLRQLVSLLIERFGEEVYHGDTGRMDIAALLEIASDEEIGLARAMDLAGKLFGEVFEDLESIENLDTVDGLETLVERLTGYRARIRSELQDVITALSETNADIVRAFVDEKNGELLEMVHENVFEKEIRIFAIDGSEFVIEMGQVEQDLVAVLESRLADLEFEEDEADLTSDWKESRLGIYLLVARLGYAFGVETLDEGSFSVERFSDSLLVWDSARLGRFADLAFEEEKAKLESVYRVNSDFVTEEEVAALGEQISLSRPRFLKLYLRGGLGFQSWWRIVSPDVLRKWEALVQLYESQLRGVDLVVVDGDRTVRLPVESLVSVSNEALADGLAGFLDAYSEFGESYSRYWAFKNLSGGEPVWGFSRQEVGDRGGMFAPDVANRSVVGGAFSYFVRLPGVIEKDVTGLGFDDLRLLEIPIKEAKDLMRGSLNLRALGPGSGLRLASEVFQPGFGDYSRPYFGVGEPERYRELSWRDQRFRVFREIVLDYWDLLVGEDGSFSLEVFRKLIRREIGEPR